METVHSYMPARSPLIPLVLHHHRAMLLHELLERAESGCNEPIMMILKPQVSLPVNFCTGYLLLYGPLSSTRGELEHTMGVC